MRSIAHPSVLRNLSATRDLGVLVRSTVAALARREWSRGSALAGRQCPDPPVLVETRRALAEAM